jgi:hypothetical protein
VDLQGHNRISARLSDIAKNGCYVDTINPFAARAKVHLTITKDNQSFETKADVVYFQTGMGLGLFFTETEPAISICCRNGCANLAVSLRGVLRAPGSGSPTRGRRVA